MVYRVIFLISSGLCSQPSKARFDSSRAFSTDFRSWLHKPSAQKEITEVHHIGLRPLLYSILMTLLPLSFSARPKSGCRPSLLGPNSDLTWWAWSSSIWVFSAAVSVDYPGTLVPWKNMAAAQRLEGYLYALSWQRESHAIGYYVKWS